MLWRVADSKVSKWEKDLTTTCSKELFSLLTAITDALLYNWI